MKKSKGYCNTCENTKDETFEAENPVMPPSEKELICVDCAEEGYLRQFEEI